MVARVSPGARRRIEAAAAKAGMRVGRWARRALLRAADDETKKPDGRLHRSVKVIVDLDDGNVQVVRDDDG